MTSAVPESKQRRGARVWQRTYLALELPEHVRLALDRWRRSQIPEASLAMAPSELMHLVVAQLGRREPDEVASAIATLRRLDVSAPRFTFDPVPDRLPRRGGAGAITLLTGRGSAVSDLQREFTAGIAGRGVPLIARRLGRPHLTLARESSSPEASDPMSFVPLPEELCRPILGVRACLYGVQIKPGGLEYTQLAQVELSERAAVR